jgi:lipopolysaccharide assembly protein A
VTTASRGTDVGRRRISPRLVIALVVMTLVAIFIAQNRDTVRIQLFTVTLTSPMWLILVIMIVLGVLLGFLVGRRRATRRRGRG